MSVSTFGVTHATVKAHFFPSMSAFSTNTTPSQATVTEEVQWSAADLDGRLRERDVVPSSITTSTSAAYLWCAKTLSLMVAIAVARSASGSNPDVVKAWREELKERFEDLSKRGVAALGDGASSSSGNEALGPSSHISTFGLTTADSTLMSTSEPIFRKDDKL